MKFRIALKAKSKERKQNLRSEKIPRVSVVIPVYNGEKFLEETVTSVLNQTFTDWEIIIINDYSTDDTQALINRFTDNERIFSLSFLENKGISVTRNTGISKARGEFIALSDCDDIWLPDHLKEAVDYLDAHPQAGGCSCYAERFEHQTGQTLNILKPTEEDQLKLLLLHEGSPISQTSAFVFRRKIAETIGLMDEELKFTEDWEFLVRMVNRFPIGVINKVLVRYRVHGGGLSHRIDSNRRYSFIAMEKVHRQRLFESESFFRKCKARLHLIYAGSYYHHTDRRLPIVKHLMLAFLIDPLQVIRKLIRFLGKKERRTDLDS